MKDVYAPAGPPAHLGVLLVAPLNMCNAVGTIDNGPVAALERPLPLLSVQRLSTTFNTIQHPSTPFNTWWTSSVDTR